MIQVSLTGDGGDDSESGSLISTKVLRFFFVIFVLLLNRIVLNRNFTGE